MLVGLLVPLAVLEGLLRPELPWRVVSTVVVAGLVPTLLWRRTMPLAMVGVAFGGTALLALAGVLPQLYTTAFLLVLPYALLRWGSGREVVFGLAVLVVKVGVTTAVGDDSLGAVVGGAAVVLTAIALGAAARYRAGARSREVDQVKSRERERLARDLHDTVAHHVSAIAIRAQAGLATAPTKPAAAADALRVIEGEASRALAEMRAMVRVLRRDEPGTRAPEPGIADVERLASRGKPVVEVGIVGAVGELSPAIGSAVFRLAQESVTNARKHARHATRVEVRVTADDESVHLRVSDDGDGGPAGAGGYGLIGMVERVGLLGGTCVAGPDAGRGWTVSATLPRGGA
ncbi:two-component sensor histidine kinase [Actinokineospora sp. NBRC 105648]|nr:two-component sensor histidine kinase [Actinokineospora sp. NBRC 105648]